MNVFQSGSTRKALVTVLSVLMLLGALALPSSAAPGDAGESITDSTFEGIDGNANADLTTKTDWNSSSISGLVAIKADRASGSTDHSFGNGTKEDTAVPTVVDGSIPPNKSDLLEFGAYKEINGNNKFLHLFWTRVQDPSGTTNMDFELNQKSCVENGTTVQRAGCSSNGMTPDRSVNDLLITYDLSNGGTVASISLRRWNGTAWGPSQVVNSALASGSINNTTAVTLAGGAKPSYSVRTFGEASINLNAIFTNQTCQTFGSAYLKSRSSDSFTSAVKDFIAPQAISLTNCGRLVVHKRASSATGGLLAGAGFTIQPANESGTSAMTELSTGVFCIDNLRIGTEYTVTESTVPAGYKGGAPQKHTIANSDSCSAVTSSTSANLTFVNNRLQGYIDIIKKDDSSPTKLPLQGAVFHAYIDANPTTGQTQPGAEDSVSGGNCTTDADGLCSIGPLDTGPYWVVETTTPAGYDTAAPQRIDVTGDNQRFPATFVDPRKPGSVKVAKVNDIDEPMGGITFQLYRDDTSTNPSQLGSAVSGKSCTTATETNVQTGAVAGQCTISGILPTSGSSATWWVKETNTPATHTAAAAKKFTLGLNEAKDLTATSDRFVNARKPSKVVIEKVDDTGTAMGGITFQLYSDNAGVKGSAVDGKSCTTASATTATTVAGRCEITGILPPSGNSAAWWVGETNTPATYTAAAPRRFTLGLDQTKSFTGTGEDGHFVNPRKPSLVKVEKVDDTGAPMGGVTFQLFRDANGSIGSAVSGKSCTTAAATNVQTGAVHGECAISQILPDSGTSATWWIKETNTPAGYVAAAARSFTLGLGEVKEFRGEHRFVNNRMPSSVRIKKTDDAGTPMGGITFQLHLDNNADPAKPGDAVEGKSCTTAAATDANLGTVEGVCTIAGILPASGTSASWWIVETSSPAGYDKAAPRKVTLGLDDHRDLTGNPFINHRLFKVITIVCKEADSSLYQSSVTFDGETKSSLAKNATLPEGVSEAEVCGLGGASFGSKRASSSARSGSVTIAP